jgi:hypothetical protein
MQNIMKALKDSVASPIVSQEEKYEEKEVEEEAEMPALEPVSMSSASDAGPRRNLKRSAVDTAKMLYVEPDPLSTEFTREDAKIPEIKRKPGPGKLGWTQYYEAVNGGFDRAKQLFKTRSKDNPDVSQFLGMVYKQYVKYLDSPLV